MKISRILLLGCLGSSASLWAAETKLCGSIYWKAEPIKIDDFHHRMICGDPTSRPWEEIPLYQAKIHLEAFLQSKGFATPNIVIQANRLLVDQGPLLKLKDTKAVPDSPSLDHELLRYRGNVVTPGLLNQIETTAKTYFRNNGYACAKVSSTVDITTGRATVTAKLGELRNFGLVEIDPNLNFKFFLLERYYSFKSTDKFRLDDLTLTRQRIDESEVVSGSYFITKCEIEKYAPTDSYLQHKYILGTPRTLRFGFGADTESGPFAYVGWKNNRFTSHLGQLSANAVTSFERQTLSFEGSFYPSLNNPRFYYAIKPGVHRDVSTGIEEIGLTVGLTPGYSWDTSARSIRMESGPYFIRTWHRDSSDVSYIPDLSMALKFDLFVQAHDYEIKKGHPESGSDLALKIEYRNPFLGFFTEILRVESTFKKIWNLGYCAKSECFLAIRQNTQINFVDDYVKLEQIPPSLQTFIGDIKTLRGFAITNALNPGLTQGTLGIDFRIRPFAVPSFEPYLLADVGRIGRLPLKLDPDILYAYGLGLRWFSPIGMVNGFITRSKTIRSSISDQWYFFLGLGEGF